MSRELTCGSFYLPSCKRNIGCWDLVSPDSDKFLCAHEFTGARYSYRLLELGHTIAVTYEVYRVTIIFYGVPAAAARHPALGAVVLLGTYIATIIQVSSSLTCFALISPPHPSFPHSGFQLLPPLRDHPKAVQHRGIIRWFHCFRKGHCRHLRRRAGNQGNFV